MATRPTFLSSSSSPDFSVYIKIQTERRNTQILPSAAYSKQYISEHFTLTSQLVTLIPTYVC